MNWDPIIKEAKTLAYSLIGTVITAATLAALSWLGAHIPLWTAALTTVAGGYASGKALG